MNINPIKSQYVSSNLQNTGQNLKKDSQPAFTSYYEIDGNSVISRDQVFTLGTLMNNFWLQDTRNTFFEIKRKNVMGKFTVRVNDLKDKAFEDIMQRNNIKFTKTDKKVYY